MKPPETTLEPLDQYDYFDEDVFRKRGLRYHWVIGVFVIEFSAFEHELELQLVESIHDREHISGFTIIKKLTMSQKIVLYEDLSGITISFLGERGAKIRKKFDSLRERIKALNTLRNKIIHAKWHTLDEKGFVRTAVEMGGDDQYINFKKTKLTPRIIRSGISEASNLALELSTLAERIERAFRVVPRKVRKHKKLDNIV